MNGTPLPNRKASRRSCPLPPRMRRPSRKRDPATILASTGAFASGTRSVSLVVLGVKTNEVMSRSLRKSRLTTADTVSFTAVSTSKMSSVTGNDPRRAVLSSGSLSRTESIAVIDETADAPLGVKVVGKASNRSTARVTRVSGRLTSKSPAERPSAGKAATEVSCTTASNVVSLKAAGLFGQSEGHAAPPSNDSVHPTTATATEAANRRATRARWRRDHENKGKRSGILERRRREGSRKQFSERPAR